jgi:hypothetical protein
MLRCYHRDGLSIIKTVNVSATPGAQIIRIIGGARTRNRSLLADQNTREDQDEDTTDE